MPTPPHDPSTADLAQGAVGVVSAPRPSPSGASFDLFAAPIVVPVEVDLAPRGRGSRAGASSAEATALVPRGFPLGRPELTPVIALLNTAVAQLAAVERDDLAALPPIDAALFLLSRVTREDDAAAARAVRLFERRRAAEKHAGGFIGPAEMARELGHSRQTILDWTKSHRLLAVDDYGRRRYPLCQLNARGGVLDGLDRVLQALAVEGVTGWMALDVLLAPEPRTGRSPIELLHDGRIDDGLACAAAYAEQGAG